MTDTIKKVINNKKTIMLILNLLIGFLLLFLINIKYETNDDWYLSLISQGFFGQSNSQYLIYSNVLLGYILKPLYLICSSVNWHVCIQLLLLSICGYCIWRCTYNEKQFLFSVSINIMFWFVVLINAFNSIQYTKTAGIISIVGLFALYYSYKQNDRKMMAAGFVISVFGFLYRKSSFLLTLPFIAILVLIDLFKNYKIEKEKCINIIKKILLFSLVIGVLFVFDKIHYNSESWKDFNKINEARTKIVDYNYLPYNENKQIYNEIGYSSNDWEIMMEWLGDDTNKFVADDLAYATNGKEVNFGAVNIKNFITYLIKYFNIMKTHIFLSLLLTLFSLFDKKTRTKSIAILFIELITLFLLFSLGRYPDRVLNIVYSCHVVSFIYLFKDNNICQNNNFNKVLLLAISICFVLSLYNNKKDYYDEETRFVNTVKKMDGKYIVDISYENVELQNEEIPYLTSDISGLKNCDFIFSWVANSPLAADSREERGFNVSPYQQLLDNDTYLVTKTERHANLIETYLKENYDNRITKQYVGTIYCGDITYLVYSYTLLK